LNDAELETQIVLLESPLGGEPDIRERERAAAWLLAHPERAYPALLANAAEGVAGPASIELLGRFGNADSVVVLAGLLGAPEPTGRAAAQALAEHSAPEALDALRAGLREGGDAAVRCADALAVRGDAAACPALREAATSADAVLRYHAVQAAASPALQCLGAAELSDLAASDADPDVRALARSLLT
jgi:hypothetical protein